MSVHRCKCGWLTECHEGTGKCDPCPCGESHLVIPRDMTIKLYFVHCTQCGRTSGRGLTKEEAVERWNHRLRKRHL